MNGEQRNEGARSYQQTFTQPDIFESSVLFDNLGIIESGQLSTLDNWTAETIMDRMKSNNSEIRFQIKCNPVNQRSDVG
ncbi:hypothetical protein SLEP1_g40707 [Rubroshorea leprosula]|uniref:Uncharacterized protein n=1 Tax=Rubroshorea leprosula TaxID=152421 RepID=A0AAV5L4F6_9ROSI|nr:hypothetical protein SLEP1_g40707 [Rubroshorea leprosula]